eukprot:CAMPEP_0180239806 /NCGR_PEP_ID=MMETSP0987-20121128/31744_1 /TAXON_ID=697907 /ORGANISM="non described non described, Strain CCMP2293" /LENGTH=33 /DNA_ID= /DNA_START= /DNA_END= /DNA_ORIENTATION=
MTLTRLKTLSTADGATSLSAAPNSAPSPPAGAN